ncbi:glycine cleavage T C-terminal barrel domain-containing protein [Roseobacter sp. S98]|uniref:glycine cleavage T C-terminal barrel domain-containing protein n=1 Tax=Roseobacter algicola (ex Choi et al. 2025) (nom. illeg.) TaxID=3092138 RepID=UPI0035C6F957
MTWRPGLFDGRPLRIARVSFTGDLSFELSVDRSVGDILLHELLSAGDTLGARLIGVEALSALCMEKGYIMTGKDTDGETMPHDLGFSGPRTRKKAAFVGDRSLRSALAESPDRKQLTGLQVPEGALPLPVGAHIVEYREGRRFSVGYVTSSTFSPALGRPVALGLVEAAASRTGQMLAAWHMGEEVPVMLAPPTAFDPEGSRLDA